MKIVFFGSAEFGIPSLEALVSSDNDLVHIFTQPARAAGRKRNPRPTPVAIWANENSIPCTETGDINSPEMLGELCALGADLLVVIAFGQKVSRQVIDCHPMGAINVHASLLPKYRGAAPINWAIINNETETGISIITLADRMDAGDVLARAAIAIADDDDAQTVGDKLAVLAPDILIETIAQIAAGTVAHTPQDESQVTFAPKLKKADGLIDWSVSAESISSRIRGLWPWPGAQAVFKAAQTGKSYHVTIAKALVVRPPAAPYPPGSLDESMNVICGTGALEILEIKPAGGKLMDFKAFLNGRGTGPDDIFLPIDQLDF